MNLPLSTACISLSTVSSFRSGEIKNWANLKCWDKVMKHELVHTCICNMHNYHMFSVTVGKKIMYKISVGLKFGDNFDLHQYDYFHTQFQTFYYLFAIIIIFSKILLFLGRFLVA